MPSSWFMVALLVLLITARPAPAPAAEPVRLATQPEGHGLSMRSIPYIKCTMETLEQPFVIISGPWERAQRGTQDGTYDGFFIATQNAKRDLFAVRSTPFLEIRWFYITSATSTLAPNDATFPANRFAADRGTARLSWLQREHAAGRITGSVISVDSAEQLVKMVLSNRVDVGLINGHLLDRSITNLELDEAAIRKYPTRVSKAGLYMSRQFLADHPQFLARFNQTMDACKARLDR